MGLPTDAFELLQFTEEELISVFGEDAHSFHQDILFWKAYEIHKLTPSLDQLLPYLPLHDLKRIVRDYLTPLSAPPEWKEVKISEGVVTEKEQIIRIVAQLTVNAEQLSILKNEVEELKQQMKERLQDEKYIASIQPDELGIEYILDSNSNGVFIGFERSGYSLSKDGHVKCGSGSYRDPRKLECYVQDTLCLCIKSEIARRIRDFTYIDVDREDPSSILLSSKEARQNAVESLAPWIKILCQFALIGNWAARNILLSDYDSLVEIYPPQFLIVTKQQLIDGECVDCLLFNLNQEQKPLPLVCVKTINDTLRAASPEAFNKFLSIVEKDDRLRLQNSEGLKPGLYELIAKDKDSTKNPEIANRYLRCFAVREKIEQETSRFWSKSKSDHYKKLEKLLVERGHALSSAPPEEKSMGSSSSSSAKVESKPSAKHDSPPLPRPSPP